jgi:hypothetical protein
MRWQAHMAGQPQLLWFAPASWPAGDGTGQGRRVEGEDDGTYVYETKTAGAWVKNKLKLIFPSVKSKTFEYHFFQPFKINIFSFMTMFI